jgi:hypothetical protein
MFIITYKERINQYILIMYYLKYSMKVTIKSKCRECNGHGYYCDYRCDARGIQCTHRCSNGCDCEYAEGWNNNSDIVRVRDYEVDIPDDVMKIVNEQIDKENPVDW